MTTATKEYAQLAAMVYATTDANKLTPPPGWEPLELIPDLSDGFSAGVFRRIGTTEIVIAYTGTNASKIADTAFGNLPAATGQPSSQVLKAMLLYERVKATPEYGDNISFTGHSLGGGLAGLMAGEIGVRLQLASWPAPRQRKRGPCGRACTWPPWTASRWAKRWRAAWWAAPEAAPESKKPQHANAAVFIATRGRLTPGLD